ncbi:hypothetical protein HZA33_04930 [Candidatus Pacearchaeota archaeon]|nr:hypothetical protein [Candidatus Pacearchaeota archaeon]
MNTLKRRVLYTGLAALVLLTAGASRVENNPFQKEKDKQTIVKKVEQPTVKQGSIKWFKESPVRKDSPTYGTFKAPAKTEQLERRVTAPETNYKKIEPNKEPAKQAPQTPTYRPFQRIEQNQPIPERKITIPNQNYKSVQESRPRDITIAPERRPTMPIRITPERLTRPINIAPEHHERDRDHGRDRNRDRDDRRPPIQNIIIYPEPRHHHPRHPLFFIPPIIIREPIFIPYALERTVIIKQIEQSPYLYIYPDSMTANFYMKNRDKATINFYMPDFDSFFEKADGNLEISYEVLETPKRIDSNTTLSERVKIYSKNNDKTIILNFYDQR